MTDPSAERPGSQPPMHDQREDDEERWATLRRLDDVTEGPLVLLSVAWLGLLIVDLLQGLPAPLEAAMYVIWGLFIADFVVELLIAPDRAAYLRSNVLVVISLVVPAARVLRIARVAQLARIGRAARPINLVRVVTSVNRGIRQTGRTFARRGAGYVALITAFVALGGAAGIWAFENPQALAEAGRLEDAAAATRLDTYPAALWWTLMILVTMGTDYWPLTAEGRILTLLLALYGFAVFGYITATIASHFLGQDRAAEMAGLTPPGAEPGEPGAESPLVLEIRALRAELEAQRAGRTRDEQATERAGDRRM
jgi:voltage-gated potassium channel